MFMDSCIYDGGYDGLERQHSAIDLMLTLNHLVEYTCRELLNSEGEFEVAQFEKAMRRAVRARHFHEREPVFAAFSFWYPEFVSGCWLLRWVLAGFAHQWVGGSMQSMLINNSRASIYICTGPPGLWGSVSGPPLTRTYARSYSFSCRGGWRRLCAWVTACFQTQPSTLWRFARHVSFFNAIESCASLLSRKEQDIDLDRMRGRYCVGAISFWRTGLISAADSPGSVHGHVKFVPHAFRLVTAGCGHNYGRASCFPVPEHQPSGQRSAEKYYYARHCARRRCEPDQKYNWRATGSREDNRLFDHYGQCWQCISCYIWQNWYQ